VQAKATVDIVEVDGRPIAAAFQVSCAGVICVGISAWFAILFRFHFVGFNSLSNLLLVLVPAMRLILLQHQRCPAGSHPPARRRHPPKN
jgi:hypothetical protein